jgi:hypothetical protein
MLKVKQLESQKMKLFGRKEKRGCKQDIGYGDIFLSTMNLMCNK